MRKIDIADRDTLYKLYVVDKMSAQSIARLYSVTKQVVLRNLDRNNIPRRGSTELKVANKRVIICDYCGSSIVNTRSKRPHVYKHTFCNVICKSKWMSDMFSGTNSWSWKGGCRRIDYGPSWQRCKKIVISNTNRCQVCGSCDIDVHHLIPFNMFRYERGRNSNDIVANSTDNLMVMCKSCHGKLRRKEASETIIVASEYILDKAQKVGWSELHSDMQTLAEMTKALVSKYTD
jgi:predicted nucleic acid-binding Zn ribbon protein